MNQIAELNRVSKLYSLPDFVKQAEFEGEDQLSRLPDSAFADREHQYPIHTKAAACLSNARFWSTVEPVVGFREERTAQQLLKAAEFWDLKSDPAAAAMLAKVA